MLQNTKKRVADAFLNHRVVLKMPLYLYYLVPRTHAPSGKPTFAFHITSSREGEEILFKRNKPKKNNALENIASKHFLLRKPQSQQHQRQLSGILIGHVFLFLNLIFIAFFSHYQWVSLYPPVPSNHHTVGHVQESFFFFVQPLHLLTYPLPTSCHLLSIYESVSVLPVRSVCSLDSTYKWNQMVFVFFWLAYLT